MSAASADISSIARGSIDLSIPLTKDDPSSKAAAYANQLYEARCNGQWASVGELARKVEKHAPHRRCMTLAARAGSRMYPNSSPEQFNLAEKEFGEHLAQAVRRAETPPIDILDGTVARAAMLFGVGRPQSALSQLPEPLHRIKVPTGANGVEAWASICVLQGTLVRGLSLELLEDNAEAAKTYRSIIGYLSQVVKRSLQYSELRRWVEELLCRICLFFKTAEDARPSYLGEAMACFHLLSQYLDGQAWRSLAPRGTFARHTPRQVWRAYFETLSKIIRDDLVYHPSPSYRDHDNLDHRGLLDDDDFIASRIQQRADLRLVESNYEHLLLKETQFPKANEPNEEAESWVELVMGNWNFLCGPTWTQQELGAGPGGKAVVARNTLDILYRAATKTFHSTQILRHLFTVHAYLGEFDIAFKAFDTYVEIMEKGKIRAGRSGQPQAGLELDDDETAVRLAAEAIRIACRLGSEATAEKSLNIGETLQKWLHEGLDKGKPASQAENLDNDQATGEKHLVEHNGPQFSPAVISLAHRAIGISQAQYARSTSFPASRREMQEKALYNLRQSLNQGLDTAACVESYYALSLILAETRDTTGAVQTAKQALNHVEGDSGLENLDDVLSADTVKDTSISSDADVSKHVKLLPVWHLLAQLLCAREDFDTASTCCDLCIERLGGMSHLLQKPSESDATKRSFSKDFAQPTNSNSQSQNPADAMDKLEKQVLLEINMTRLSLYEVIDGPEAAVNGANELLALFARLFGEIDVGSRGKPKGNQITSPPKSSSGTIRSMFSRPKSMRRTAPTSRVVSGLPTKTNSAITTRPTTSTATKPAIQVIDPTGGATPASQAPDQEQKSKHNVLRKKSSSIKHHEPPLVQRPTGQLAEKDTLNGLEPPQSSHPRVSFEGEKFDNGQVGGDESKDFSASQPVEAANHPTGNEKLVISEFGPTSTQTKVLPVQHLQDRGNQSMPAIVELQEQRFKVSLLIKIWLFVARLYTKVSFFDDAKEAIREAHKLISGLEKEVLKQNPSIRRLQDQGWGRGKSVEELWADVFIEDGKLYACQSLPHDALECFEKALWYHPDHPEATVALSGILLDIYCQTIPAEKQESSNPLMQKEIPTSSTSTRLLGYPPSRRKLYGNHTDLEPSELSRLACRDRAYGLLSSLTKLGAGWDDPEAWFMLARAYEESGQIDKAKEALWWTVHLEDTKPIRHWRNVNPGGYVL